VSRIIPLLLIVALVAGCGPQKMTPEEIAKEKKAVEEVAISYSKSIQAKDTEGILNLFSKSSELLVLGTDSAEVFKNLDGLKSHFEVDWELLKLEKFDELRYLSMQISPDGKLASALFEVPYDLVIAEQMMRALLRLSMTMIKEDNQWHIVQLMGSIATVGQSSEDLLAKMKEEKAKGAKK